MSEFPLLCEKCVRDLGEKSSEAVQLVALFKPSKFGRMAKAHPAERRHRCLHCGFVNVFHPVESRAISQTVATTQTPSWREFSIKS